VSISSEIADLAILLFIICIPLVVGAILIPIGRAFADRLRRDNARQNDLDGVMRALHAVDARIGDLSRATEANTTALEGLAARRLPELPPRHIADAARPSTPH